MLELLQSLFGNNLFIPHGHCYLWKPALVGLHIASDSLIALAYYSIPITLVYFVQKRQDFPFKWILLLFGAFIVSCGTTHVMEIWTLWHPTYWLSGFLKFITAKKKAFIDKDATRSLEDIQNNPSTIYIRTEVADSMSVIIRIADNGCGMTEEIKSKIFDPFFTTKPVGSGTGLGMSISYEIIEKHNGHLKFISAPLQRAEFIIQIPIHIKE